MSWTGVGFWTKENADKYSKLFSEQDGEYYTSLKTEPVDPSKPEECWAITNRFDPKVREEDANTSA